MRFAFLTKAPPLIYYPVYFCTALSFLKFQVDKEDDDVVVGRGV